MAKILINPPVAAMTSQDMTMVPLSVGS